MLHNVHNPSHADSTTCTRLRVVPHTMWRQLHRGTIRRVAHLKPPEQHGCCSVLGPSGIHCSHTEHPCKTSRLESQQQAHIRPRRQGPSNRNKERCGCQWHASMHASAQNDPCVMCGTLITSAKCNVFHAFPTCISGKQYTDRCMIVYECVNMWCRHSRRGRSLETAGDLANRQGGGMHSHPGVRAF